VGEVYRARDPRLGREVAIKVLRAEMAGDPERVKRFEKEARSVASPSHANVLALQDVRAGRAPFESRDRERLKGGARLSLKRISDGRYARRRGGR